MGVTYEIAVGLKKGHKVTKLEKRKRPSHLRVRMCLMIQCTQMQFLNVRALVHRCTCLLSESEQASEIRQRFSEGSVRLSSL